MNARTLTGRCLRGAAGYEVADESVYAMNCHCSRCRKATGSAFRPMAGIGIEKLRLASGEKDTMRCGDDTAHDVRCRACGPLLYSVVRDERHAHVTLSTLDDDPSIRPTHHIHVGSKASWFAITDDLPRHEEFDA